MITIEELAAIGAADRLAEIRAEMATLEEFLRPAPVVVVARPARRRRAVRRVPTRHHVMSRAMRKQVSAWMKRYHAKKRAQRVARMARTNARLRAADTRRRQRPHAAVVQAQVQ